MLEDVSVLFPSVYVIFFQKPTNNIYLNVLLQNPGVLTPATGYSEVWSPWGPVQGPPAARNTYNKTGCAQTHCHVFHIIANACRALWHSEQFSRTERGPSSHSAGSGKEVLPSSL